MSNRPDDYNDRILIIDDQESIHDDYRKVLGRTQDTAEESTLSLFDDPEDPSTEQAISYQLDFAFQGIEAIEMVEKAIEAGKPYAMAFVDMRMPPGIDGLETVRRLIGIDPKLRMVISTAFSDYTADEIIDTINNNRQLKMMLRKPFDIDEIRSVANTLVDGWNQESRGVPLTTECPEGADPGIDDDYVAFLCVAERRADYAKHFKDADYPVQFVSNVDELVTACIRRPPAAAVLDLPTQARLGLAKINPLYSLRVSWPILRANILADGRVNVLCQKPERCKPLPDFLAALKARDDSWNNPEAPRDQASLQFDLILRTRVKIGDDEDWSCSNSVRISGQDAFVVHYGDVAKGTEVTLEIRDLASAPLTTKGHITQTREWESGPILPGFRVEFDPSKDTSAVTEVLTRSEFRAKMIMS